MNSSPQNPQQKNLKALETQLKISYQLSKLVKPLILGHNSSEVDQTNPFWAINKCVILTWYKGRAHFAQFQNRLWFFNIKVFNVACLLLAYIPSTT